MRLIIAGSRSIKGEIAEELVRSAILASGWTTEISEVVHGDAVGVDTAAHKICSEYWPVTPVPADWSTYGNSAGPIRNHKMAKMADALIAIYDGESRGTKNMVETAKKLGLRIYVHHYKTEA